MRWVITLHCSRDLGPLLPAFRQWLGAHPANRDRFAELWEFWQELSALKDRDEWRSQSLLEETTGEGCDRRRFPRREVIGITLIAVITLGIGLYLSRHSSLPCTPTVASTATQCLVAGHHASGAGETLRLDLFEGSTVTLSEKSQVTLDLRKNRRHVSLEQGEARFQVAKNITPFYVFVDDGTRVRAVGTDFSVRKTGSAAARVAVREGAVSLLVGDLPAVSVKAGQVAEFDSNLIRLTDAHGVWFIFRDEPLTDAVLEFNRYNRKHKISVDADVSNHSVQGQFPATNPLGFAQVMALNWRIQCFVTHDSTGTETIHLSRVGPHRAIPHKTRGRASVEEQQ